MQVYMHVCSSMAPAGSGCGMLLSSFCRSLLRLGGREIILTCSMRLFALSPYCNAGDVKKDVCPPSTRESGTVKLFHVTRQVDWDKWVDEDEEDEKKDDLGDLGDLQNLSNFGGGMGGMPGMAGVNEFWLLGVYKRSALCHPPD